MEAASTLSGLFRFKAGDSVGGCGFGATASATAVTDSIQGFQLGAQGVLSVFKIETSAMTASSGIRVPWTGHFLPSGIAPANYACRRQRLSGHLLYFPTGTYLRNISAERRSALPNEWLRRLRQSTGKSSDKEPDGRWVAAPVCLESAHRVHEKCSNALLVRQCKELAQARFANRIFN